jgi:hypothetical protein
MSNKNSSHILGAATNLLGICLVIITSLHLTSNVANSLLDEFVSIIAFSLILSATFSYLSLRNKDEIKAETLEKTADFFFLSSLFCILIILLILVIKFY